MLPIFWGLIFLPDPQSTPENLPANRATLNECVQPQFCFHNRRIANGYLWKIASSSYGYHTSQSSTNTSDATILWRNGVEISSLQHVAQVKLSWENKHWNRGVLPFRCSSKICRYLVMGSCLLLLDYKPPPPYNGLYQVTYKWSKNFQF